MSDENKKTGRSARGQHDWHLCLIGSLFVIIPFIPRWIILAHSYLESLVQASSQNQLMHTQRTIQAASYLKAVKVAILLALATTWVQPEATLVMPKDRCWGELETHSY